MVPFPKKIQLKLFKQILFGDTEGMDRLFGHAVEHMWVMSRPVRPGKAGRVFAALEHAVVRAEPIIRNVGPDGCMSILRNRALIKSRDWYAFCAEEANRRQSDYIPTPGPSRRSRMQPLVSQYQRMGGVTPICQWDPHDFCSVEAGKLHYTNNEASLSASAIFYLAFTPYPPVCELSLIGPHPA